MNCDQVQRLLSRFHDGELNATQRAGIELHLGNCALCLAELSAIAELAELVRTLGEPEPPAQLWEQLARRLECKVPTRFERMWRMLYTWKYAAAAALLLLALGAAWLVYKAAGGHEAVSNSGSHPEMEHSLDGLLAAHTGERVSLQEAARRVNFRVLALSDLPEGFRLGECCLCQDGCCDLVQCRLLCGTDQVILVQCRPDHPVRFGDRPVLETRVNGKAASIVQRDGCLICSWQTRDTALTLAGPRDLSQLVRLVAYVDQRLESKP
jgi:hypothetical protein